MALFALILVMLISSLTVRVGRVALTMTGLDRRKASFQALSAFTTSGWTTRETELLMSHDQRRRIVMLLMVLGHAGLASGIVTLIESLGARGVAEVFAKVAIISGAAIVLYLLARWRGLDRKLTAEIEKRLRQTTDLRVGSFEEVLLLAEGYGILEIYVTEESDIANKSIGESRLRNRGMVVLAVDREGQIIPAPDADTILLPGHRLICYGKVASMTSIANEKIGAEVEVGSLARLQA
jgi:hypothetical protein